MTRPYPYYPAYDGGKETPGIRKLLDLMAKRWGVKSLGTYVVRNATLTPRHYRRTRLARRLTLNTKTKHKHALYGTGF